MRPSFTPVYVVTIAEGAVDRSKHSLQSGESAAVTHEDVVIGIVSSILVRINLRPNVEDNGRERERLVPHFLLKIIEYVYDFFIQRNNDRCEKRNESSPAAWHSRNFICDEPIDRAATHFLRLLSSDIS